MFRIVASIAAVGFGLIFSGTAVAAGNTPAESQAQDATQATATTAGEMTTRREEGPRRESPAEQSALPKGEPYRQLGDSMGGARQNEQAAGLVPQLRQISEDPMTSRVPSGAM